jgi:mannose-1-phosphate guanylyltransferase
MQHAVIMAGGSGTRLWPLSRRDRPKQLLHLFDGQSLLQLACRRLEGLFDPANVYVVTSARYIDQVAEALPSIPHENLIGEPVGRDTANAIGLAAHLLVRRDPQGTMAVFTADHLITPQEEFARAVQTGLGAVQQFPDSLVTFGITPTGPHTGYGYIHRGAEVAPGIHRVLAFKEKPAREVAERYVELGEFYWNSGIFVWRLPAILRELARHLPENSRVLGELAADWGALPGQVVGDKFGGLEKISIDYAVMERAADVLVVGMQCRWLDVGSWLAVGQTRTPDEAGNVAVARHTLAVDATNNILISEADHLLAVLGARDLVVVHSADATLICGRDHAEAVRELAVLARQRFGARYE